MLDLVFFLLLTFYYNHFNLSVAIHLDRTLTPIVHFFCCQNKMVFFEKNEQNIGLKINISGFCHAQQWDLQGVLTPGHTNLSVIRF